MENDACKRGSKYALEPKFLYVSCVRFPPFLSPIYQIKIHPFDLVIVKLYISQVEILFFFFSQKKCKILFMRARDKQKREIDKYIISK